MLPTDVFFTDIERVIAEFSDGDRPRARKLIEELGHIAGKVPRVADRCYAYQARLYTRLQEFPQALAAVAQALNLMPLDDTLVILRGDIHREAQEFSQALQDYSQVLNHRPDSVTARMHRAEAHQAKGHFVEALQDLNAALKVEPRSMRLLYRRALVLVEMRRSLEAVADLKTVARLSPDGELKKKAEARLRELGER